MKINRKLQFIFYIILFCSMLFIALDIAFPLKINENWSKQIVDEKGVLLHLSLSNDDKWRLKTELNEISPTLQKTIIEKEDKYFYFHPGVNILSILRASFNNTVLQKRTSGASTITMQVARMIEKRPRTIQSKLIEIFRAFQLEWNYSKSEILQWYLNLAPYGGNIEGVKSASFFYFNKNPYQLSLSETVILSIIPNRPNSINPEKNIPLLKLERDKWLTRFKNEQVFSEKAINDALAEPISYSKLFAPRHAPHFSNRFKIEKNHFIKTNLNYNTQLKLEKITKDYIQNFASRNIRNAAVIVIENKTMKVKAYVGSADFFGKIDGGQVDGIKSIRQPGSTLKPILYALCLDRGIITPQTIIYDVPINYEGFSPENYDKVFHGKVSAEYALSNSLNIPAVSLLNQLGKNEMINILIKSNFKQIEKDRKKLGLSMILGGCGVSLEELTGLYAAFANNGIYRKLCFLNSDSLSKSDTLISSESSYMIHKMLSSIARPDLPVNWEQSTHLPRIAWKTGTSYGRRDAWSIGYNQKYTIGVWVGNFSGEGVPDLSGAEVATPLLFSIFNTIDYNSSNETYAMPSTLQLRYVCSETGMPVNSFCKNQKSDYFIPMVSSNVMCDHEKEYKISIDEKFSYCIHCLPQNGYKIKSYPNLNPDYLQWLIDRNIANSLIPPHNKDCDHIFKLKGPQIVSPINNSEYLLNILEPEPISLYCKTSAEIEYVYWYVNDKLFKKARSTEKLIFMPDAGPLKISCSDDKGRNTDVFLIVKKVKW